MKDIVLNAEVRLFREWHEGHLSRTGRLLIRGKCVQIGSPVQKEYDHRLHTVYAIDWQGNDSEDQLYILDSELNQ